MTRSPEVDHPEFALRLMRIASSIAAQLDPAPLLQQIVDVAAELVGAEFSGILVLDENDPTGYKVLHVHGWSTPCGLAPPQRRGILGLPHKEDRPLRLAQADSSDETLTVTVQDNGVGIPPARLTSVMEGDGYHAGVFTLRTMVEQTSGQLTMMNGEEGGLVLKAKLSLQRDKGWTSDPHSDY
jgi:GAF domain-containing protein